jgi:hypothetical protein
MNNNSIEKTEEEIHKLKKDIKSLYNEKGLEDIVNKHTVISKKSYESYRIYSEIRNMIHDIVFSSINNPPERVIIDEECTIRDNELYVTHRDLEFSLSEIVEEDIRDKLVDKCDTNISEIKRVLDIIKKNKTIIEKYDNLEERVFMRECNDMPEEYKGSGLSTLDRYDYYVGYRVNIENNDITNEIEFYSRGIPKDRNRELRKKYLDNTRDADVTIVRKIDIDSVKIDISNIRSVIAHSDIFVDIINEAKNEFEQDYNKMNMIKDEIESIKP